jgi:hypothetical protein
MSESSFPALTAFISYANPDQAKAEEIARSLEARELTCWIAPRDVRPGRPYGEEIIRGIERSGCLVLVLSEAANNSVFVAAEVERAVSNRKPVFTVRIDKVLPSAALQLFVSGTQWIDATAGRLGPHIDRLVHLLAGTAPPPVPLPRPKSRLKWTLVAGAVAAVLIVGIILGRFASQPSSSEASAGPSVSAPLATDSSANSSNQGLEYNPYEPSLDPSPGDTR